MKKFLVLVACLLPIFHAPAAAKDDAAVGPSSAPQAPSAPAPSAEPASPRPSVQDNFRLDSIPTTGTAGHRLIRRFDAAHNAVFGVGVWQVTNTNRHDPNRQLPMRDRTGKMSGVAAVGFNFSF